VRHPFYGCAGLLILANALMAANWFLLLGGVVFVCLIVVRTRTEEELLVARFGDAYRVYMRQTGRFLPRLRPNRPGACATRIAAANHRTGRRPPQRPPRGTTITSP
jgi:steroid 5-alpha reductase family enzyme